MMRLAIATARGGSCRNLPAIPTTSASKSCVDTTRCSSSYCRARSASKILSEQHYLLGGGNAGHARDALHAHEHSDAAFHLWESEDGIACGCTKIAVQREQKAAAEALYVQPGYGRFLPLFESIQAVLQVAQVFAEGTGLLPDQFANGAYIRAGREVYTRTVHNHDPDVFAVSQVARDFTQLLECFPAQSVVLLRAVERPTRNAVLPQDPISVFGHRPQPL